MTTVVQICDFPLSPCSLFRFESERNWNGKYLHFAVNICACPYSLKLLAPAIISRNRIGSLLLSQSLPSFDITFFVYLYFLARAINSIELYSRMKLLMIISSTETIAAHSSRVLCVCQGLFELTLVKLFFVCFRSSFVILAEVSIDDTNYD